MAYTDIDKSTDYFNTVLYTGNATTPTNITGVGFQPDWVWIKNRDNAEMHILADAVRGANKLLESNTDDAELSDTNYIKAFQSDGFQIGSEGAVNGNTQAHVAWNWLAGTSFSNDASSTSVGSIDSAGSVSTAAGFSIISYTGTGSAGTIAHGLGAAPAMIIFKNRSRDTNWLVYHKDIAATKFLYLNVTDAEGTDSGHFNDTEPTSTVFSVGGANGTNYSGENLIAYCFAEKKGYSKFGSYTGNGNADGTFVYTGFKPAWTMIKRTTDATEAWIVQDNKRSPTNPSDKFITPSSSEAESTTTNAHIDYLSNGFKLRHNDTRGNTSGITYIYMAFAESPFVTSTGIPTTAR